MIIGQLTKTNYSDGSWRWGFIENKFDEFIIVLESDGVRTAVTFNGTDSSEVTGETEGLIGIMFIKKNGNPVMAKRKKHLFGLIKGKYLPKPE